MSPNNRRRLILLTSVILFVSGVVAARLYHLQIVMNEPFRIQARNQQQHREEIPARRGAILDREGRELAVTLETFSLFAHPPRVEDPRRAAHALAPILGLRPAELLAKLRSDKKFVYLSQFLGPDKVREIRALDLPLGANQPFDFETELKRVYPHGKLATHVVGYATIDDNGIAGVEHAYDAVLKGDPAVYLVLHDARDGRLRRQIHTPEKQPEDLLLTLDATLQYIVEDEIEEALRTTGASAATALLMNPATGQILALVNRPAPDPNRYGKSSAAERANRATQHIYEPGSTFKTVTMAAALELDAVRLNQPVFCENGLYRRGRRLIHDTSPHDFLTPPQILAKSSNIGMVKLTEFLDPERFHEVIVRFGFGAKTGIELSGEAAGLLAPVSRWSAFSQASLSFGQEIGVTALQMASAFAVLANDGVLVPPRVVLGTRNADGSLARYPAPASRRVISDRTAQHLRFMMEGVVDSGTGKRSQIPGYRVAGKSGTAQMARAGGYSSDAYMASFGGFAPVEAPRLVGLVLIDSPRGDLYQGGQVAAPVFARVMTRALHHLRIPPTQDNDFPMPVQRVQSSPAAPLAVGEAQTVLETQAGQIPDVHGLNLRQAVALLAGRGCRVQTEGNGVVSAQFPAAGAALESGRVCHLMLSSSAPESRRTAG